LLLHAARKVNTLLSTGLFQEHI